MNGLRILRIACCRAQVVWVGAQLRLSGEVGRRTRASICTITDIRPKISRPAPPLLSELRIELLLVEFLSISFAKEEKTGSDSTICVFLAYQRKKKTFSADSSPIFELTVNSRHAKWEAELKSLSYTRQWSDVSESSARWVSTLWQKTDGKIEVEEKKFHR